MPLLEHNKAIKEFFFEVQGEFPNMEYDQFERVCKSPFLAIKFWIASGDLYTIHIKYLGKFKVFKDKIGKRLNALTRWRDEGKITDEQFQPVKTKYEDFLKRFGKGIDDTPIEIVD